MAKRPLIMKDNSTNHYYRSEPLKKDYMSLGCNMNLVIY